MNHCRPPQNWSLECGAVQIAARQKSSQTTDGQYLIRFCKVLYRTLVRINIPFSGDPNLFDYSASGFGNHIDAELVDDGILLTHMTEHPDAETIKKDFDNRMTQIDTALSFIRTQADEWNRLIPNLVKPAIEKRQATLQRDSNISLGYPMASPPPPRTVIPSDSR